jgi:2,4-dienoyl-CoA reductase-like NADH-dependent reductase (Old Yellow Enzyme family)
MSGSAITALVNTCTDEYGGSLENRMRFGREVVAAVRAAVPDDFIRSARAFEEWPFFPGRPRVAPPQGEKDGR